MKIHYYRLEVENHSMTISALLETIKALPLESREKVIHGKHVILENCSMQGKLYTMDFTLRRIRNGPGYSAPRTEIRDFELEKGAGFGEQTAAVYSPTGFLAVQYNHFGARPSVIPAFLEEFLPPSQPSGQEPPAVKLEPVLNNTAFTRLLDSHKQTRFECAVFADKITPEMAEGNVPMSTALAMHNKTEACSVQFALSLGGGKRSGRLRIVDEIKTLLQHPGVLKKCRVTVKPDLDAATEVLDLLEHREAAEIPNRDLEISSGRRFTRSSRYRAIRRVFEAWLQARPSRPEGNQ